MDSIVKKRPRINFTVVSNECLKDERISWKAKGLICYIMSLPDNWKLTIKDLQNRAKDGRDSVYSGFKELQEFGYCRKNMCRKDDGTVDGYNYEVSDEPIFQPFTGKPETGKPETGKPFTENPTLINTNNIINNQSNKKEDAPKELGALTLTPVEQEEQKKERKTLFANCKYADVNEFLEYFQSKPELAKVDLMYYYHSVSDWSDSKNMKRTARGWLATVRQFMRGDQEKGRLRLIPTAKQQESKNSDAVNFLKGFD